MLAFSYICKWKINQTCKQHKQARHMYSFTGRCSSCWGSGRTFRTRFVVVVCSMPVLKELFNIQIKPVYNTETFYTYHKYSGYFSRNWDKVLLPYWYKHFMFCKTVFSFLSFKPILLSIFCIILNRLKL